MSATKEIRAAFAETMKMTSIFGKPMSLAHLVRETIDVMKGELDRFEKDVAREEYDRSHPGLSAYFRDQVQTSSKRIETVESALRPVLKLAQAHQKAHAVGLQYGPYDEDAMDIKTIVAAMEPQIRDAVNFWLAKISASETQGIVEKGAIGKPLAINDPARASNELYALRDVLNTRGDIMNMVSDTRAAQLMQAAATVSRAPVGMA